MKPFIISFLIVQMTYLVCAQSPIIVDHNCTHLYKIPPVWIESARSNLHIAYGHTSHGTQLIAGMTGLKDVYGSGFAFNDGGLNGALYLHDCFVDGDLGAPDFVTWDSSTRAYLNNSSNADVNVIIWAWCGQLNWASPDTVDMYLKRMSQLELDFPAVKFVYMTGHLDGEGINGRLNLRNEQIRKYCRNNNKILYDFADIESYDPDGMINFMKLHALDNCDYDSDNDGTRDANWALQWCNTNSDSCYFTGACAHSQSLNCQQKGIAAWWLWARLAGWNDNEPNIPVSDIAITGAGGSTTITTNDGTLQLSSNVLPTDATNKTVTWSIQNGTGQALINASGLVTAVTDGTITAKATANDGSGVFGSLNITISDQLITVTSITVSGPGGVTSIVTLGGTLQMSADVLPTNATNKNITWSIQNGTGQASISAGGLVTAIANGTVTVTAISNDDSGITGSLMLTISNQVVTSGNSRHSEYLFTLHMNGSEVIIQLPPNDEFNFIRLYNLTGNLLFTNIVGNASILNLSSLSAGIYIMQFVSKTGKVKTTKVCLH